MRWKGFFPWVLPGWTGFQWVRLRFDWVLPGFIELEGFCMGLSGFVWVCMGFLLVLTGFFKIRTEL